MKKLSLFFIFLSSICLMAQLVLGAYTTTYVYDACSVISTFTPVYTPSTINFTIDSTYHMEGTSSLHLSGTQSSTTDLLYFDTFENSTIIGTPRTLGEDYGLVWGFWLRPYVLTQYEDLPYLEIMEGSTFVRTRWFNNGVTRRLSVTTSTGGGNEIYGTISLDSWYWVEVRYYWWSSPTRNVNLFINGSQQTGDVATLSAPAFGNTTKMRFFHGTGDPIYRYGDQYLDLIRYSDGLEFPPTNPVIPLSLSVSSTPINSSIVWENGTTYTCPKNFSVVSGSHTVTTEPSYRENTSTMYLFSYWTVNGSVVSDLYTLTRDITGDTTFVAVYVPRQIPSIEEGWIRIGIGLIGLILMFLSWFVGYWIHKAGDTAKGGIIWFVMFIIGYGLFTVLLGG